MIRGSYRGAPIISIGGGLEVKHDEHSEQSGGLNNNTHKEKIHNQAYSNLKSTVHFIFQRGIQYNWLFFHKGHYFLQFFIFWTQLEKSMLVIVGLSRPPNPSLHTHWCCFWLLSWPHVHRVGIEKSPRGSMGVS